MSQEKLKPRKNAKQTKRSKEKIFFYSHAPNNALGKKPFHPPKESSVHEVT